jgi:hypothetical protein
MLSKIRHHPTHFALGVGLATIGLWLICNDRFFVWPPNLMTYANDDLFGGLFAFVGLGLVVWTLDSNRSARWNAVLLTAAAGLMSFLTVYQFLIWTATGNYQSWISNGIITAFVLITARRSDANG